MPGMQGTPLDNSDMAVIDTFALKSKAPSGHLALLAANDSRNDIPGAYAAVSELRSFIATKEQLAKFLRILVQVADEVVKPGSDTAFSDAIADSMPPKWDVDFDFDYLKRRLAGTDRSSFMPGAFMDTLRDMADKYSPFYDPSTEFDDDGDAELLTLDPDTEEL